MRRNLLVIVTGPTASGKTHLAIELAKHYATDVISADSRQIFKDIPIGTAAPSPEEQASAFHHFVGILELEDYFSAARYEEEVMKLLPELWRKSPIAVMCGGSMMYVDAVVKGIDRMPTISDSTRDYVLRMLADQGLEGVLAQLKILDPDYWELVDHNNTRRVVHGVEICLEAGVPYSTLRTGSIAKRDFDIVKFAIDWPREALFERINRRVEQMMEHGLLHEAEAALTRGPLNSLNTVGYKELRAYFDGEWDLETAVARIQKNTRVYAKKQLTWLKKDPDVVWLNPQNAYTEMLNYIKRFNV